MASSGITSLLLPGERIAQPRFKILINPNEDSACYIKQGTPLAELIVRSKLIIWDETHMLHKFCFEALDKSMRDIMRFSNPLSFELPFGGKSIVFGGDFHQILPVIPKGGIQDVVNATINSSYLWRNCTVLQLTKIQNRSSNTESDELKDFSEWIASIGDGANYGDNDDYASIDLPDDILIKSSEDPIRDIVSSTYPFDANNIHDHSFLFQRTSNTCSYFRCSRTHKLIHGVSKLFRGEKYLI
ncbi:uncharacterized protein LOC131007610 [Salvia miltiorrhiza]|uniref:uncharacterized protein LOC131007610 n=1 Tax=Salvia miltiorrhiza TaxID=226208 RepID=UPI0025AD33F2|nr:uncharacterized protein LOC131007610 [Salvia miltiorrhiza]